MSISICVSIHQVEIDPICQPCTLAGQSRNKLIDKELQMSRIKQVSWIYCTMAQGANRQSFTCL